jgi:hypothetical protein
MATIRKFEHLDQGQERPTEECKAAAVCLEIQGEKFVQLNSYGSTHRVLVGKRSQNMRLSREAFEQLIELGKKHFGVG